MGARLRSDVAGCDRVRRLAPAAAVGMGGSRACGCGVAGRRGCRPHQTAPPHRFLVGGRRNSASSWRAHAGAGACGILAPGPGSVRTDHLPAADGLGPNACRCSCEGESQSPWMLCSALACRWHRPGVARRRRVRGRVQPRRQAAGHRRPPLDHRASRAADRRDRALTCMPARTHLSTRSVSRRARYPLNGPLADGRQVRALPGTSERPRGGDVRAGGW